MHKSSMARLEQFVDTYLSAYQDRDLRILDVGSRMAWQRTKTNRSFFEKEAWTYVGLDIQDGTNVDIIPDHPYDWKNVESDSFDVVISGSVIEHIPYFWVTFFEIGRVLKEGGVACIIGPGGGPSHDYPADYWRFFGDGLAMLSQYIGFVELESGCQEGNTPFLDGSELWRDCFLIMQKPAFTPEERRRFLDRNMWQKRVLGIDVDTAPDPEAATPTPSAIAQVKSQEAFANQNKVWEKSMRERPLPVRLLRAAISKTMIAISKFYFRYVE